MKRIYIWSTPWFIIKPISPEYFQAKVSSRCFIFSVVATVSPNINAIFVELLDCPFAKSEIKLIQKVTAEAVRIIDQDGNNARTAQKALKTLSDHMHLILEVVKERNAAGRNNKSLQYQSTEEDFTFTYEEETDPEVFFVPYVWEVIVCLITSASIEWERSRIKVFALLDVDDANIDDGDDDATKSDELELTDDNSEMQSMIPHFARDVTDIV